MHESVFRRAIPAVLLAGLAAAVALPLAAQPLPDREQALASAYRSGAGAPAAAQDFLFGAPDGSLSFRIGRLFARTDGEVFAYAFDQLTIEPRDLDAIALAAELALRAAERVDLVVGGGYSRTSIGSEFRDWVDEDDQPIRQTTRLRQLPLTVGGRLYITPRGRAVSRFAWIPARAALFLSAGAGVAHYSFEQSGDFVDFEDLAIFTDDLRTSGWAALAYVGGGVELRMATRASLLADVRYTQGSARPGGDFEGFEDIGLGGLATSVGVALTF